MPLLKFITNVPEGNLPSDVEMKLSSKMKQCIAQWGEEHFTIWLLPGQRMIKARNDAPCAVIEVHSCLTFQDVEVNREISRVLIEFSHKEMGIHPERIMVGLYDLKTDCVGLADGRLVSDLVKEMAKGAKV